MSVDEPIHDVVEGSGGLLARPVRAVWIASAVLAAVTVAVLSGLGPAPLVPSPWWLVVPVILGFALAELVVFHIEYRRETISFTLSEVPLAFALVFLGPPVAVLARLVGFLAAMGATRPRPQPFKVAFNLATFSFEVVLAAALLDRLPSPTGGRLMGWLMVALLLSTLAGWLLISMVVSFFEGGFLRRVRGELRSASAVYLGSVVGVVAVSVALLDPLLAPLPIVLILAFWLMVRAHGQLGQHHRDLVDVHGFTGAVVRSLALGDIAQAAVSEVQRLLRAEHGALVVLEADGSGHRLALGPESLLAVAGRLADEPGRVGEPVVLAAEELDRLGLGPHRAGLHEVVVTTIGDGAGPIGVLLVANREGALECFSAADRDRLGALAGQLAAALRNGLMHDQIEHEVTHDRLTGLANRTLFERTADEALAARSDGERVAVLMVDLDRFKEVNDTLGHHVGDRLLVAFSQRVRSIIDPDDLVARFAGDEFAILARRRDVDELGRLAASIVAGLRAPFDLGELSVVVAGSIGIACCPGDGDDVTTLLRRSDIAMYEAKSHHSGWELYRTEIDRSSGDRLALHGELRGALDRRELQLYFQPKVDLATATVVGVEALARWIHPVRGFVPPDEFVALAEQTGLIHQLTDQVLWAALAAARHWQDRGASLGVAVNLSAHNLLDELLPDRVTRALGVHGVDPRLLTLEITETSVMSDAARTLVTLDRLHRLGVTLSVDDFGTGYSSLTYLRRLPIREVKIDRSFVAELLLEDQDEVIVRSTIDLGHNLGLRVVAEGAEDDAVLDRLRDLGCDQAQGYGISRPLSLADFDAWLADGPYAARRATTGPGDRVPQR